MSNKCKFKLVEARNRYWHWVFYSNGKPIAASAKAGKSQKNVADAIRVVMEGAADATIEVAPMKLDEHMEAQEAGPGELPHTEPTNEATQEEQSLPAAEAVEG